MTKQTKTHVHRAKLLINLSIMAVFLFGSFNILAFLKWSVKTLGAIMPGYTIRSLIQLPDMISVCSLLFGPKTSHSLFGKGRSDEMSTSLYSNDSKEKNPESFGSLIIQIEQILSN